MDIRCKQAGQRCCQACTYRSCRLAAKSCACQYLDSCHDIAMAKVRNRHATMFHSCPKVVQQARNYPVRAWLKALVYHLHLCWEHLHGKLQPTPKASMGTSRTEVLQSCHWNVGMYTAPASRYHPHFVWHSTDHSCTSSLRTDCSAVRSAHAPFAFYLPLQPASSATSSSESASSA